MPLNSSAPPGVATPSRPATPGLILTILATASFIAVLDLYITSVGLSYIGRGIHESSLSNLSWVLSAYAITYAAYLLLGPGLPDRDAAKAAWRLNS
jgi:MFS family permease